MQKIYKYIIIGAGIAAVSAAQGIREIDKEGSVLMIGDEAIPAYSRPMSGKSRWPSPCGSARRAHGCRRDWRRRR